MESFIGHITMFGGNFAPRSWAFCHGQLLPISQNTALFSILGTIYGGDGRTTFALPDLRGRVPIQAGNGPGLPDYRLGQKGGTATNILNITQLPSHTHQIQIPFNSEDPTLDDFSNAYLSNQGVNHFAPNSDGGTGAAFNSGAVGGNQAINNMPPYLAVNFIIALQGTFPSRS